jgi:hypothetical protein
MKNYVKITGAKHIYTLKEGEQWAIVGDKVIIVHPERKPKMIDSDGTEVELELHS